MAGGLSPNAGRFSKKGTAMGSLNESTGLPSVWRAFALLNVAWRAGIALPAAGFAQQIDIERLLQSASTAGTVNVVVTLKLRDAYVPEEQLLVPDAIERQRASISQVRNTLLASLRAVRANEYQRL